MWSKYQQTILWIIAYSPLVLVMIFRFIAGNNYFGLNNWLREKEWLPTDSIFFGTIAVEIYFVLLILVYTFAAYKLTIVWFLFDYEKRIRSGEEGESFYIRKAEKLSANDYSFFLLTLLLPLISLDHSSVINLSVSLMIISFVILVYVKTDAVSVCPIIFFSGRNVYKGIISKGEKSEEMNNPSIRKEVIFIIKRDNISFSHKVRGEKLVNEVYYLTNSEKSN